MNKLASPSALAIGLLMVAMGCTKGSSPKRPTPASSTPAAAKPSTPDRPPQGDSSLAGIELGKLDPAERKVFDQVVAREASACGKGHSLLHSVTQDRACRRSFYAARYVARLADVGASEAEIGEKLAQRFREPPVEYIDVSRAPSKGAASASVKVVEFADYQCAHCQEAQALMGPLLAKYPKDVILYFKHFPLTSHNALNAAMAAAAAQKQGKFWPFAEQVWQRWDRLTPAVLEEIAKGMDLDFPRWYGDVGSEEVRALVTADKQEARALSIRRTPAFFINGRRFTDEIELANLSDWIDEELGR
jgi:2-hydroxychromene-2-carboxylate isomerase